MSTLTVTILPKRGSGAPTTSDLADNEIGYDTTNDAFYMRNGASIIRLCGLIAIYPSGKFGDVDGGDYSEFESDGTLKFVGDATPFEDLQVSISNVKIPTSNAPTERLYAFGVSGGVTFPALGFAVGDYIYFDVQTSHSMKLNTILDNHIHYSLPNTTTIGDRFKFQLDVIAAGVNVQWAVPTGSPFSAEFEVAANDNSYHRIGEIADIPASNSTVSSLYKCKLTRIAATADEYGSEVYLNFTDCHYEKDTIGSRTELSK